MTPSNGHPTVSIVIDNHDNADLLPAAIDSALGQTHQPAEVVVVDDGSRDRSGEVIASYAPSVVPVLQDNGGQASALNAGYARTSGDLVIFLDSDDVLEPSAIATVVDAVAGRTDRVARVQWPMRVIDGTGTQTGQVVCDGLDGGLLADRVLQEGPFSYGWSSTSGNAWSRTMLDAVLPIPTATFRLCPDIYLSTLVPLFGEIVVTDPQSRWRRHAGNASRPLDGFDTRLAVGIERFEACLDALATHARRLGHDLDPDRWRRNAWFHRLQRAVDVITSVVPAGATLLLADEDAWEAEGTLAGRRVVPFLEYDGVYGGPPSDDQHAWSELQRIQAATGASHLAVGWPAAWWLDHYPGFFARLDRDGRRVADTRDVTVMALPPLRPGLAPPPGP